MGAPFFKTFDCEFKADVDKGTVEGHGAIFRDPDDPEDVDHHKDTIVKGAFERTIKDRLPRDLIKYGDNHRNMIGTFLVLEEDSKGLHFVAKVAPTTLGKDHLINVKEKVIAHSSIGFDTKRFEIELDDDGWFKRRILRDLELWEISGVNWPAEEDTTAAAKNAGVQEFLKNNIPEDTDLEDVKLALKIVQAKKVIAASDDQVLLELHEKGLLELLSKSKDEMVIAAKTILKTLGVDTTEGDSIPSDNEDLVAKQLAEFRERVRR